VVSYCHVSVQTQILCLKKSLLIVDTPRMVFRIGTTNVWDIFADAQLWSAAVFMQGLRFLLPAGRIWTPGT
jgi:hypothetical protein